MDGTPTANEEASDVAWIAPADLAGLEIHQTQQRQLRDYLDQAWLHVD